MSWIVPVAPVMLLGGIHRRHTMVGGSEVDTCLRAALPRTITDTRGADLQALRDLF